MWQIYITITGTEIVYLLANQTILSFECIVIKILLYSDILKVINRISTQYWIGLA